MTAQGNLGMRDINPPGFRLLSIPGRSHENKYFAHFLGAIEQQGGEIVEPRLLRLGLFQYDVLHINFPSHQITENKLAKAFALSLMLIVYLLVARALGRKIIYTVHDVVPLRSQHEALLGVFLSLVHWVVSAFVFLSQSSRQAFVQHYPRCQGKRWTLAPHGPYDVERLGAQERLARRRRLTGDPSVFLVGFLGAIKPYKHIEALQDIPAQLSDGRRVHLVVAGRVEPGYDEVAARVLDAIPKQRLTRLEQRLTDQELNSLIQAVDIVLLPYARGSNSGAAILVLSNQGRLIGSKLDIFKELQAQVGAPWAYALDPSIPVAASYAAIIHEAALAKPNDADHQRLDDYLRSVAWNVAAKEVVRLCHGLRKQESAGSTASPPVLTNVGRTPCVIDPAHPGDGREFRPP